MTDEPTQAVEQVEKPRVLAGRYRVDSLIGRGGMASVYRGFDETLGRVVAIKILRRDLAGDDTFRTRFRLEAQAASRMSHPSIVRVFDAGEDLADDGMGGTRHTPYIVMELVQGTLLKDIIARGPVSSDDAVRYVDGILEALEYSHRAGVVHRDIKPANVMVTDAGQVKVMDFGIARAVSDTSATVAETTTILGTAAYFSPEQAKGDPVDARADLYSTGVVLYELLTGVPPFRGDSPVAVAYQHVREAPVAPSLVEGSSSPASLDPVALRALAKDPEQRFPDAAVFREQLDEATDGRVLSARQLAALTDDLFGDRQREQDEVENAITQLENDETAQRTQSGPPIAWIWTAIIGVLAVVAAVVFWVIRMDPLDLRAADSVAVPEVAGQTFEAALADLEDVDLIAMEQSETSPDVPEGIVTRTDPAVGTPVTPGSTIDVYVSEGQPVSELPELLGLTEEEAREAIERAGLQVGRITPVNNAEHEAGVILAASVDGSDVSAGDEVAEGATVDLTRATGRVTVDNVEGFTIAAATERLESQGLTVQVVPDDTCEASDTVQRQSDVGDVAVHSTIELFQCSGSPEDPEPTDEPTDDPDEG